MRIISGSVSGVSRLPKLKVELSTKARQRLKWFDYYDSRGRNARLTCRHFDISPQTFYRWKRRYNPRYLESLEDHVFCVAVNRVGKERGIKFSGRSKIAHWFGRL